MSDLSNRSWIRDTALWKFGKQTRDTLVDALRKQLVQRLLKGERPFRVLVLIGQKRSGNHVLLNWYMSQCPGMCLLFNNVSPLQVPIERRRQELRLNGMTQVLQTPPTLIFSYEDHTPDQVMSGPLKAFLEQYSSQIISTQIAMVMRDPRNLIASRIQKWPEEFDDPARLVDVRARYIETADLMLSPPEMFKGHPFVPVLYNAMITSEGYRNAMSSAFGIPQGARGLNQVANYGHGSSFDGESKSGKAQEMQVFRRWERFAEDPRFQDVFSDAAITALIDQFDARVDKVSI